MPQILNRQEILGAMDAGATKQASLILDALDAALLASDPQKILSDFIKTDGTTVKFGALSFKLSDFSSIKIVAFGKAAGKMSMACEQLLIIDSGIAVVPHGTSSRYSLRKVQLLEATHPTPSEKSVKAATQVLEFVKKCGKEDLLLVLISGGASSLCCAPAQGLELSEKIRVTKRLNHAGANISELNCVRKHLSAFKGGRLLQNFKGKHAISLVMSDVQGNPLDVIASGPTVLDPTTFSDAKSILEKYGLWDISLPACMHVQKGIEGKTPETLKTPAKSHDIFIVADNSVPVNAAIEFLGKNGVKNIARTTLSGTASKAGKSLLARLYNRDALVAGGETTVKVRGGGRGGRNQELVLGALLEKADFGFLVASIGTDGIDGASDMAGAIAKSGISKERNAIARALEENDSEGFLKRNKMCINIGPTGTNLNDICIVLRR